eukprot:GFYU01007919.1.p1 GENE.GFYU01007919.1~~GFYU01007919.1.p1  ORF type:complete len:466 (+),score=147.70 GFYU01007919.1:273-1670(+)
MSANDSSEISDAVYEKKGLLKFFVANQWEDRCVAISGNFLFIYETETSIRPDTLVSLNNATIDTKPLDGKDTAIAIKTAGTNGVLYKFGCPSAEDRDDWASVVKIAAKISIYNFYELKGTIGRGAVSVVKAATRRGTQEKYAVKIIEKERFDHSFQRMVEEVSIMLYVDNPNVMALKKIYETDNKIFLVMELLKGGELFDRVVNQGSFSEKDARAIVLKIVKAIQYLHTLGVVHRDLKPENLIYKTDAPDAEVIITDFSLSRVVGPETLMKTACGTPGYAAPEVLRQLPYDNAVDLWSIGVIMYILLCGFPPFYGDTDPEIFNHVLSGRFDFPQPYWNGVSDNAKHLICGLLQQDPAERFTVNEVLVHPWIVDADVPELQLAIKQQLLQYQTTKKLQKSAFAAVLSREDIKHKLSLTGISYEGDYSRSMNALIDTPDKSKKQPIDSPMFRRKNPGGVSGRSNLGQ